MKPEILKERIFIMADAKRKLDMHILKPGEQIPVDLKNATQTICECGCQFFIPVVKLFMVSAILSPIGKELSAQVPVLICLECKKPWEPGKENSKSTQNFSQ